MVAAVLGLGEADAAVLGFDWEFVELLGFSLVLGVGVGVGVGVGAPCQTAFVGVLIVGSVGIGVTIGAGVEVHPASAPRMARAVRARAIRWGLGCGAACFISGDGRSFCPPGSC